MIIQSGVTAGASYSFNAASKTITFSGTIPANLEAITLVSNNSTGALMFAPGGGAALAGTWSSPVLTLACDTTGMANGNALTVLFENGQPQAVAPNVSRGSGVSDANTQRVTLPTDGPTVVALGAPADSAASSDSGSFAIIPFLKRLAERLTSVLTLNRISTTGTIGALNEAVSLTLSGQSGAFISVVGTYVGTIRFEASVNDGATWDVLNGPTSGAAGSSVVANTIVSLPTLRNFNVSNYTNIRATFIAYTSGTADILIRASNAYGQMTVFGNGTFLVNGAGTRASTMPTTLFGMAVRGATAAPTAVTNGQAVDGLADTYGRVIVRPWSIPELTWSYVAATGGIVNTTDVTIASAAGAGLRRYITGLTLSNDSATATSFVIKDGASTVLRRFRLPANAPNVHVQFPCPLFTTANQALIVACETTASAVYVNADGFTAP